MNVNQMSKTNNGDWKYLDSILYKTIKSKVIKPIHVYFIIQSIM